MRREWEPEELIASWTLLEDKWRLVSNTDEFVSVASREVTDRVTLRRRLLLVQFGLGTNMRRAITRLVNAMFEVRDRSLWGQGTACQRLQEVRRLAVQPDDRVARPLRRVGRYRPDRQPDREWLAAVLARPIRFELIVQNYDQLIRCATALRLGTAEAEQVLRRFTRGGPKHPTFQALEDLGRAVGTISSATTSPRQHCAARSTRACKS